MIYIDFNGRCGDQFFQYAFARKIQIHLNDNERMQFNFYNEKRWRDKLNDKSFRNDLKFFNIVDNNFFESETDNIQNFGTKKQKQMLKKYERTKIIANKFKLHFLAKVFQKKLQKNGIYFDDEFFDLYYYPKKSKNVFLKGYFEDYKFFYNDKELISALSKELVPLTDTLKDCELLSLVKKTNSICVSMRSWGEVSDMSNVIKSRSVCNLEYYEKAINKMSMIYPDAVFIIFADDIQWAKKMLGNNKKFLYEDGEYDICEKIRLMSNCKHFIISNSSFSWWVQFLSSNKDKTIVSPNRWYNDKNDLRLLHPNWYKINS